MMEPYGTTFGQGSRGVEETRSPRVEIECQTEPALAGKGRAASNRAANSCQMAPCGSRTGPQRPSAESGQGWLPQGHWPKPHAQRCQPHGSSPRAFPAASLHQEGDGRKDGFSPFGFSPLTRLSRLRLMDSPVQQQQRLAAGAAWSKAMSPCVSPHRTLGHRPLSAVRLQTFEFDGSENGYCRARALALAPAILGNEGYRRLSNAIEGYRRLSNIEG